MSHQVDFSLIVPAPIPSVRALQASPEVLTPVRHGFLWKRSRLFKTWISRWFELDTSGFLYAVSPKVIKREGQSVLPSPVGAVRQLPPQRYRNGAMMYGIRVISVGGSCKDLYSDDLAALDAWALDLSRCTRTAREQAAAGKAAAALASQPSLLLLPPPPPSPLAASAGAGELQLSDICEMDWSHMLGSGLFACVLRARMHVTGEAVAVKIVKAESFREYGDIIEREAAVWAAAGQHPHVVRLKQTLRSSERMYFISELCEGGSLVERLATSATYCEREVAWLVRQLLAAVEHLHSSAIVHMDIKPENLVFATRREDSCIKLIDFSLASFFYSPTDPGGTPDFVAPELLNHPEHYSKNGCGPEVDMWAVGVIIFFLLSGQTPFQAPTLEAVLQRVKTGEWAFHGRRWALVSEGARDLVSSLLRIDPSQRLTATEALDHPWLRRPDSLSQALLQDAVAAFRLAAAASMQQQRTSWVKQASGDLMTTNGTNLSPHTSLSRFAVMAGSVGPASFGGGGAAAVATGMGINAMNSAVMGAALTTGGGHCLMGLLSSGAADAVAAMIGPSGAAASSAVMISSSASQHQLNQAAVSVGGGFEFGGGSARGSLGGGQRGSNTSLTVAAGPAAAGVGSGSSPTTGGGNSPSNGHLPQQNSFTAGVGSRYAAAVAMAPHCSGSGSAGSPPRLPASAARISPHNSHHSPGACTQRSPRSPLGMRTRRASDTMAYTLAITERHESIHQMQAQGIAVPPAAGCIGWPGLPSAKARRASELLPVYGTAAAGCMAPSPSDSQAELAAASAAVAAASASVDRGNHSAPGTRYVHHNHHHLHGHHHPHYGHPLPLRGASGLSVMTSATATGVSTPQGDGRPTGGRSNPELFSMLRLQSSSGGRSIVSSSTETTPHTSSRDCTAAGRNSWTNIPSQTSAPGPAQIQGQPHSQQGQLAGASLPPCDQALLAMSKGLRQGVPGKSQSYNAMPSIWVDRPAGRGQSTGQSYNVVSPAGGGAGAMITQRRASMSFTLGASVSGLALMPHGPSPLSNSSGGRNFLTDAQTGGGGAASATAAGASGGSMPALLQLKRPSRRISGGGNLGTRSSSSTPAHASPANSNTSLQAPSHSAAGGTSGGGSTAARSSVSGAPNAGGTGFPSSSSMYAAVLRSNLSGHGLGGGGGGNAASCSGGADGGGGGGSGSGGLSDEGVARQSSLSASGSVTVGNNIRPISTATGSSPPPTRLGSSIGPTSPPSPLSPAAMTNIVFSGVGVGGSGRCSSSNIDPFLLVGGGGSWDNRPPSDRTAPSPPVQPPSPLPTLAVEKQLMHEEFRVMYSSGSNAISGSNSMVSERLATQGSFIEATLMTANFNGSGTGHTSRSGAGGTIEVSSGPHGRTQAATMDVNGNLKGGTTDLRRLQQPPSSTMALSRGVASGTIDSENDVFSIALNIVADGSDGAGSSGNGAGGGGQVQSGVQLRSQPRSGSQHSLVCSGTSQNSEGSPRADCNQVAAGGAIIGNSLRSGAAAGAGAGANALAVSASGGAGGGGPGSGTAPTGATDSGANSIMETLRSAGVAPRASSRLVLETIPSEDPDSLSGLLRSVREERAAAIASAASGAAGGSAAIATSASGSSVGAGGFSSGPGGFGTGTPTVLQAVARPLAGQQQQLFSPAPSPLSRRQVRAFLSPQASSTSLAAVSLPPSCKSVLEPSSCDSGGGLGNGGGGGGGTKQQQQHVRASSGGSSGPALVSHGSGSVRSTGSVRSGSVRRSATANNLRLHATTAAAAQAAAAAAATAGDCITSEPDPFAAWDYPPPSLGHPRQRATSAVGLSGPSLMALLAQAAPLAQAAQAFAAVQIANSQSSSAGSSFTSQRSGIGGGINGGIRAAVAATPAVAPAASTAADGAAALADVARTVGAAMSQADVRRSSTATNLNLNVQATQQLQTQAHQQQQGQFNAAASRGASAGNSSSSNKYLAGIVAQAAPLAQAAQTSAVAQAAASRAASCSSHQSISSSKAAAAVLIGAGGGGGTYGLHGRGTGSGAVTPTSYGSESPAGSPGWARRATTSNDLRDRALSVQLSGNSIVHRLASQQGPSLATAALAGAAAGVGLYSSSPPREPGSPASLSSRGSTFPVVPSRLSNSGNCTPTARCAGGGIPSPSHVLSPQGSLAGGGSGSVGAISQRALMAVLQQQQQPQLSGPSVVYHQQLQQMQQVQQMQQQLQLQQLQHFHNMQQLRHQQQKGVTGAAPGRTSRADSAAAGGLGLRVSTSASVGTIDTATQAAIMQEMSKVTVKRSSCAQMPPPHLYE